jgi:hypothetical protein
LQHVGLLKSNDLPVLLDNGCSLCSRHAAPLCTLQGTDDAPVSDQYLDPFVIVDETGQPVGKMADGDAVVLFNFRADRMVEISKAFEYTDFSHFDRVQMPSNLRFVGMMQYDGDLKLPSNYLVPPPEITKVGLKMLMALYLHGIGLTHECCMGQVVWGMCVGFISIHVAEGRLYHPTLHLLLHCDRCLASTLSRTACQCLHALKPRSLGTSHFSGMVGCLCFMVTTWLVDQDKSLAQSHT